VSVRLYMDVHVRRAVTEGLRLRKVDVLTAQDDESAKLDDPELLDRATELGRILFSQDDDLLREAKRRQQSGELFKRFEEHSLMAERMNSVSDCIERWPGTESNRRHTDFQSGRQLLNRAENY
jgi:predicted nuclease of predicted toxin-antitoxin system